MEELLHDSVRHDLDEEHANDDLSLSDPQLEGCGWDSGDCTDHHMDLGGSPHRLGGLAKWT